MRRLLLLRLSKGMRRENWSRGECIRARVDGLRVKLEISAIG